MQIGWQKESFQMNMLRKEYFEPIHAQMEQEVEGNIAIKDIPGPTDVFRYKDRGHIETLSWHYGLRVSCWTMWFDQHWPCILGPRSWMTT
jgi:hypothetical protein